MNYFLDIIGAVLNILATGMFLKLAYDFYDWLKKKIKK